VSPSTLENVIFHNLEISPRNIFDSPLVAWVVDRIEEIKADHKEVFVLCVSHKVVTSSNCSPKMSRSLEAKVTMFIVLKDKLCP